MKWNVNSVLPIRAPFHSRGLFDIRASVVAAWCPDSEILTLLADRQYAKPPFGFTPEEAKLKSYLCRPVGVKPAETFEIRLLTESGLLTISEKCRKFCCLESDDVVSSIQSQL